MIPKAAAIEPLISELPSKKWREYSRVFREQHKSNPEDNWDTLQSIFDMLLQPSKALEPFDPMIVMDGKRSMIPTDLTDQHLDAMEERANKIIDPEFQSRIFDILWVRRRDFPAAEKAIKAYLQSGERLEDPNNWIYSMERYERAVRLASSLGKNHPLLKMALGHLENRVQFYNGTDEMYFSYNAVSLLYEFRFGDPALLATIVQNIALRSVDEKNHPKAFEHYELAAKLYRRAGDTDKSVTAFTDAAEQKVAQAEAHEAGGSFMAAHTFWNEAIQCYRKIAGSRERIKELHNLLNLAGQKMYDEMGSISTTLDVREEAERVQESFRNLTFSDSMCQLSIIIKTIDPAEHRKDCERQIQENPLQFCLEAKIHDAAGRLVAKRPSVLTKDPEEAEKAMIGAMNQQAHFLRHYSVAAALAPAIHMISEEHYIDEEDIKRLLENSDFIPEGRVSIFARAIRLGFEWDFSTSLHLFIPQAENSLRHLLAKEGIITTSLDHVGIEEAWPLGKILSEPKLGEIIGESRVYELRSLLLGETGANIRNLLSHGLLNDTQLNSHECCYLWWILLQMAIMPTPVFHAYLSARKAA